MLSMDLVHKADSALMDLMFLVPRLCDELVHKACATLMDFRLILAPGSYILSLDFHGLGTQSLCHPHGSHAYSGFPLLCSAHGFPMDLVYRFYTTLMYVMLVVPNYLCSAHGFPWAWSTMPIRPS